MGRPKATHTIVDIHPSDAHYRSVKEYLGRNVVILRAEPNKRLPAGYMSGEFILYLPKGKMRHLLFYGVRIVKKQKTRR